MCSTGYYYVFQANARLKPVLPPLAAQRHLQQWLEQSSTELMEGEPLFHLGVVTDIYQQTDYKLLWVKNYELTEAGEALLQQLMETSADDLVNYQYHLTYIQQRLHYFPTRPKEATAIDIMLTDAFVAFAEDVLSQRLQPKNLLSFGNMLQPAMFSNEQNENAEHYNPHREHLQIVNLITTSFEERELDKAIEAMSPSHSQYVQLREALQHYQDIAQKNVWRPFEKTPTLRPGDRHPQIEQLRKLLTAYGDYPEPQHNTGFNWFKDNTAPTVEDPEFFDDHLAKSLAFFQSRHGHKPDGILGNGTRKLLNISPNYRIKQIAYNMKRWRQLPNNLGEKYIWVNMTDYQLDVIQRGKSILNMKVIVGKTSRRTPVMQEPVSSIVLNPMWNVPRRIMVQDILPKARKDPSYLKQRNIRILNGWQEETEVPIDQLDLNNMSLRSFPYRLQQAPGKDNALGRVKFVIPNDYSIYLHDTNSPELFNQDYRALSSGCIRVEHPLVLAETLLKGKSGWDRDKIDDVLQSGKTTYVKLPENIPTYLAYWTSWVDTDGRVQFRDDIYREDEALRSQANKQGEYLL
ncbi:L,D-transpeptidase [Aurantivibrio plasticivorans]